MAIRVRVRSEKVQQLLVRRNYSQNGLARRLHVSSGYMSQLLHGTRSPSPRLREKLMDVLRVDDFDMLFIAEDRNGQDA